MVSILFSWSTSFFGAGFQATEAYLKSVIPKTATRSRLSRKQTGNWFHFNWACALTRLREAWCTSVSSPSWLDVIMKAGSHAGRHPECGGALVLGGKSPCRALEAVAELLVCGLPLRTRGRQPPAPRPPASASTEGHLGGNGTASRLPPGRCNQRWFYSALGLLVKCASFIGGHFTS